MLKMRYSTITLLICTTFASFLTESCLAGKCTGNNVLASSCDSESNPGDTIVKQKEKGIGSLKNGSWIGFSDFDFGRKTNFLSICLWAPTGGGSVEVRSKSPDGPLIAQIGLTEGKVWQVLREFDVSLRKPISGLKDIFFVFNGLNSETCEFLSFRFERYGMKSTGCVVRAIDFDKESHPDNEILKPERDALTNVRNRSGIVFKDFDFGDGANHFSIEAATPVSGGEIKLRVDRAKGPLIGKAIVSHTGSWSHYRRFECDLIDTVTGTRDLFLIFTGEKENLFNAKTFRFDHEKPYTYRSPYAFGKDDGKESSRLIEAKVNPDSTSEENKNRLHVYPPVSGLEPSAHYTISLQKVSELNHLQKELATNWEHPFAFYTECKEYAPDNKTAYYSDYIGGWSHTYCNFELDPETPIVAKISRLSPDGAPSGPIRKAVVHPARLADSCEVIEGDVYVTLSRPALISVDIDGQMESRNTPRTIEREWSKKAFQHRNRIEGVHAVSIFANAFIEDKPSLKDPSVFAVEPGNRPPKDGPWTTLYFKPGVHNLSIDSAGNDRPWEPSDPIRLTNDKSYYIPGDAILYGNLHDSNDKEDSENIRVFGHGTLSGFKIPHPDDFRASISNTPHKLTQMMAITRARNCEYLGITIADPAAHGFYIEGRDVDTGANYIRWMKQISWRVNNDGTGVMGNGYIEDCFLRHQDDGIYIRGLGLRRVIFWSDVNGAPLRCSFICSDRKSDFPPSLPQDLIVEDMDVIYSRGVFGNRESRDYGVIAGPGSYGTSVYEDGTRNTGQHIVFRNIQVEDPKPVRVLFGFKNESGTADDPRDWAGLRFENVTMKHPHTWGWPSHFVGTEHAKIRYFNFDGVKVGGELVDEKLFRNPEKFETMHISGSIFR